MNDAIMGGLIGVGVSVFLLAFDYMMIRKGAAERAQRNHQKVVTLDATEKKRIGALVRFCVILPVVLAGAFWLIGD
ncbi:MAG TPA: hypothetical protein VG873_15930 [Burkholderiales bacterium]|jgi:hypothetical protein|nr:hypothetical protein [Burkholderiales bacterium]